MAAAQTVSLPGGTFDVNASTNAFINAPKAGWHLLTFLDGEVAAVRYNPVNGKFVWGSLTQPTSPIVSVSWLGSNVNDIATHISTWWDAAMKTVPGGPGSQTVVALIASLDNGSLSQGQPVLYTTSGAAVTGTTNVPGSEATVTSVVPGIPNSNPLTSAVSGAASAFSSLAVFGSLQFWKGIGLVLAGVLVLVFGGLELRRFA